MQKPATTEAPEPAAAAAALRERILERFGAWAMRDGIRAVNMGKLARDLRISPTTLYKLFPSKAELVDASVERWARSVGAQQRVDEVVGKLPAHAAFAAWVESFSKAGAGMSRAFLRDLRSYPDAYARFHEHNLESRRRGRRLLEPLLRPGTDSRIAFAVCALIIDQVGRPDFAERLDVSRGDAIRTALDIWARGALELDRK